jgi:hypothetical protein
MQAACRQPLVVEQIDQFPLHYLSWAQPGAIVIDEGLIGQWGLHHLG